MSRLGVTGSFAEVIENIQDETERNKDLVEMITESTLSTSDIVEFALSDVRKEETRKLVEVEFKELEEQEKSNITDIITSLASKMRTGNYEPKKDASETLSSLLVNFTSVVGEEKIEEIRTHLKHIQG